MNQSGFDLRCEWGLQGLLHLAPESDAVIVLDVLSFSTVVDIAVSNGASVLPYCWNDGSAAEYAAQHNAILAARRTSQNAYSLSPMSVRAIPPGTALVLPSPNGSTICTSAPSVPTFTACLRNAPAVASHVARLAVRVSVIPAGERWEDDTLRPCLEDWLAAGGLLAALPGNRSPEAELAVAAFEHFRADLPAALSRCDSGRELVDLGFQCDVDLAAQYAASSSVPLLSGGRFVNASP